MGADVGTGGRFNRGHALLADAPQPHRLAQPLRLAAAGDQQHVARRAGQRRVQRRLIVFALGGDQRYLDLPRVNSVGAIGQAKAALLGEDADLQRRRRIAEHQQQRRRRVRLDEELDLAVAGAAHRVPLDAAGHGAGRGVADENQPGDAAADGLQRGRDHHVAGAAAADRAGQAAIGQHDGLGADIGRGRRRDPHHRHHGVTLAAPVQRLGVVQQFDRAHRSASTRSGKTAAMLARSAPGASRSRCGSAACMPWLTGA